MVGGWHFSDQVSRRFFYQSDCTSYLMVKRGGKISDKGNGRRKERNLYKQYFCYKKKMSKQRRR